MPHDHGDIDPAPPALASGPAVSVRRAARVLLLIVAMVGGAFAVRQTLQVRDLQREYVRLVNLAGDFQVSDPQRIAVLRLPSDDPLVFRWRLYVPAHLDYVSTEKSGEYRAADDQLISGGSGWSSGNTSTQPAYALISIAFVRDDNGQWSVHEKMVNSTGTSSAPPRLAQLMADDPSQVAKKIGGANGLQSYGIDDVIDLLELRTDPWTRPENPENATYEVFSARLMSRQKHTELEAAGKL